VPRAILGLVNLLLLEPEELSGDGTARLAGSKARHVREVLRAASGQRIRVGVVGGRMGEAEVISAGEEELVLRPRLEEEPPPPVPLQLLLALPRPKILRRVLQSAASLGVKRLVLCGSYKVERSYFGSPSLRPAAIRAELLLGLEQARDTILPEVVVSSSRSWRTSSTFSSRPGLASSPIQAPVGFVTPLPRERWPLRWGPREASRPTRRTSSRRTGSHPSLSERASCGSIRR